MTETHIIRIPIYRTVLHLFFGNKEDCKKAMIEDGETELVAQQWFEEKENCDGSFSVEDDGYTLLWLNKLPESITDYSNLLHEIEHCTFEILDSRGIKHTYESDEAFAYLFCWLYEEIENFILDEKDKNLNTNGK